MLRDLKHRRFYMSDTLDTTIFQAAHLKSFVKDCALLFEGSAKGEICYPSVEDYMSECQRDVAVMEQLASALMAVAFPDAPQGNAGEVSASSPSPAG